MQKKLLVCGLVAAALATSAFAADGDLPNVETIVNTNMTSLYTIWGKVAALVAGIALFTVGIRLFKRAK